VQFLSIVARTGRWEASIKVTMPKEEMLKKNKILEEENSSSTSIEQMKQEREDDKKSEPKEKEMVFLGSWGLQGYYGLKDPTADYTARIMVISECLTEILKEVDPDPTVLKVFVTPEFFFQPESGKYSAVQCQMIVRKLEELVSNSNFEHWVFFFGSIVGNASLVYERIEDRGEVHNFIVGKSGGLRSPPAEIYIKYNTSPVDFVDKEDRGFTDSPNYLAHDRPGLVSRSEVQPVTPQAFASKPYQTHKGVTFGIELCLDHATGVFRQYVEVWKKPRVQIHIISACGITVHPEKIAAVEDKGSVFHVDGKYYSEVWHDFAPYGPKEKAVPKVKLHNDKHPKFKLLSHIDGKIIDMDADLLPEGLFDPAFTIQIHSFEPVPLGSPESNPFEEKL